MTKRKTKSNCICFNRETGEGISNPKWSRRKLKEVAHRYMECPYSQLYFKSLNDFERIK